MKNFLTKVNDYTFEIPGDYKKGMNVPARIYGSENIIKTMDSAVFEQITNVATLPGIINYALCMPDGHSGYGFPIGGVAAILPETGVISPGGIGFDINCGVRLIATNLTEEEVKPKIRELVDSIFRHVPSGVGSGGIVSLSHKTFDEAMVEGVHWAVKNGFGQDSDIEMCEEQGKIKNADPSKVSSKARERGAEQIGSLGSGNHYLEIQCIKKGHIFDHQIASVFGIKEGSICIMIHSGSRGFGHQIATDYLKEFSSLQKKFNFSFPDRELASAPFLSEEGQNYFKAMNCAINIAFLNRQLIKHRVTEILFDLFGKKGDLKVNTVYDVCHNTAKLENFTINGKNKTLLIHRKGATRCLPPGREELPLKYRNTGQPVIIGGSMESFSYLMCGTESASETFFSTVHGSGRVLSRHQAKSKFNGKSLACDMEKKGIYIKTASYSALSEEAGGAYKNVDEVVASAEKAGLGKIVAKFTPIGNIKA